MAYYVILKDRRYVRPQGPTCSLRQAKRYLERDATVLANAIGGRMIDLADAKKFSMNNTLQEGNR